MTRHRASAALALLCGLAVASWPGPGARAQQEDTGPAAPTHVVDEGDIPLALQQVAREVAALPLGERMAAISDVLLGLPYQVDAAGEGLPPDPDPPARYDAFDCLTFVEEVLALALAADPVGAPGVRNGLRYGQVAPSYETRRHFMLTQWIPGNIADGWLVDITDSLGETHLVEKQISPQTWRWWRRRALFQLPDPVLPAGDFQLPLLSIDAALAAAEQIPAGALILTVRRSKEGVPIVVTHLGFKLPDQGDGRPMMRHATKMKGQRVMDHSLSWYLDHLRWYHNWPVDGVSVLMPQEQGPRLSRLPAPQRALVQAQ